MSSQKDNNLTNVVALKMDAEDREHLWQKTKLAFEYVSDYLVSWKFFSSAQSYSAFYSYQQR